VINIKKTYKNFLLVIIFFFISYLNYYNFYNKSFSSSILYKININKTDKIKNEILNNFFVSNYKNEENFLIKRVSNFKEKFGERYKYYPTTKDEFFLSEPIFKKVDYIDTLSREINSLFITDLQRDNIKFLEEIKIKKEFYKIDDNQIEKIIEKIFFNEKNYKEFLEYKKNNDIYSNMYYFNSNANLVVSEIDRKINYILIIAYFMNQLLIIIICYLINNEISKKRIN
jgi:hypothetical protein